MKNITDFINVPKKQNIFQYYWKVIINKGLFTIRSHIEGLHQQPKDYTQRYLY
jgi:hypothetical protein